jgi:hypothetical protein
MARREYARIGTDMPDEASIRALTVGAQWLYDRLLLSPELSRCGVLPLRVALWSDRAPDASEKKVNIWLRELVTNRHVIIDDRYAEALVRTYVRHDGLLGQPNVVAAMVADYSVIASPAVRQAFLVELRRIWDLPTTTEGVRGGWCLAMGHYPEARQGKDDRRTWPAVLDGASLARLRKAIGEGLRPAFAEALANGSVEPFDEPAPEPFDQTLCQTPYRGRDRGERRVPTPATYSGSERRAPDGPAEAGADLAAVPAGQQHTTADQLLDHTGPWVPRIRTQLRTDVEQILAANVPPDAVERALAVWRTRKAGPGLLALLVQDQLTPIQQQDPRLAGLLADARSSA